MSNETAVVKPQGRVSTLKELQKECKKIDLTKVKIGSRNHDSETNYLNVDSKGREYIKFSKTNLHHTQMWKFASHPSGIGEIIIDRKTGNINRRITVVGFQGGIKGSTRYFKHYGFTDGFVLTDTHTEEIIGVIYDVDNDYLNEWLRNILDPSIPNNYEHLHQPKEFDVLITTHTFSQEFVKVEGRTYEECVANLKKNDPTIHNKRYGLTNSDRFSGMKTISDDPKYIPMIPQSYEEWLENEST